MNRQWLYLDFDGVLHPDEVYPDDDGNPQLLWSGALFMWEPRLVQALADHPEVELILSTNWAHFLGLERAAGYLREELRARIVGTSAPVCRGPSDPFSRAHEIERHIEQHKPDAWIIVDDDTSCDWSRSRQHLVLCDSKKGLGDEVAIERLRSLLAR